MASTNSNNNAPIQHQNQRNPYLEAVIDRARRFPDLEAAIQAAHHNVATDEQRRLIDSHVETMQTNFEYNRITKKLSTLAGPHQVNLFLAAFPSAGHSQTDIPMTNALNEILARARQANIINTVGAIWQRLTAGHNKLFHPHPRFKLADAFTSPFSPVKAAPLKMYHYNDLLLPRPDILASKAISNAIESTAPVYKRTSAIFRIYHVDDVPVRRPVTYNHDGVHIDLYEGFGPVKWVNEDNYPFEDAKICNPLACETCNPHSWNEHMKLPAPGHEGLAFIHFNDLVREEHADLGLGMCWTFINGRHPLQDAKALAPNEELRIDWVVLTNLNGSKSLQQVVTCPLNGCAVCRKDCGGFNIGQELLEFA